MHRLARRDLETLFVVTLATAPALALKYFRSKHRLDREKGRQQLAALLASQVDNESSMVLVTDPVGEPIHRRPGKWGIDEPDPMAEPRCVEGVRGAMKKAGKGRHSHFPSSRLKAP